MCIITGGDIFISEDGGIATLQPDDDLTGPATGETTTTSTSEGSSGERDGVDDGDEDIDTTLVPTDGEDPESSGNLSRTLNPLLIPIMGERTITRRGRSSLFITPELRQPLTQSGPRTQGFSSGLFITPPGR